MANCVIKLAGVCLFMVATTATSSLVIAKWNGEVIAETEPKNIVELEGNKYFPENSLKTEFFVKSDETSNCPWKGTAHYYNIKVKGKTNNGAAWYYPQPKSAAKNIQGRVAFWKGVQVLEDGNRQEF